MNAALYARVSTRDQRTIPDQLADLREYCSRRGWKVAEEFAEKESGARETRPRRYELIRRAQRHHFDVVLVWKLDRWSRAVADCLLTIADLHHNGCAFVSVSEGWDFTTSMGRAMAGMLAVFAEFERERISERTKDGMAKARARGVTFGRPATARTKLTLVLSLCDRRDWAGNPWTKKRIAKEAGISTRSLDRMLKEHRQNG